MSKILGLPSGAWITAIVGIGTSYYFYRHHVDKPSVEEGVVPTSEPMNYQTLSGPALGGGVNTPGSVQVGSGEAGVRPAESSNPKRVNSNPYEADPNGPISETVRRRLEERGNGPIISTGPAPILNESIITSNQKSFVVNGGGPPSVNKAQSELVVVHGL